MKKATMHHTTTTHAPGREAALRWLSQQLRWERLLAELRDPSLAADEEAAA